MCCPSDVEVLDAPLVPAENNTQLESIRARCNRGEN